MFPVEKETALIFLYGQTDKKIEIWADSLHFFVDFFKI